jgi:hypothetical protein
MTRVERELEAWIAARDVALDRGDFHAGMVSLENSKVIVANAEIARLEKKLEADK